MGKPIAPEALHAFGTAFLQAWGADREVASTVCRHLVDNEKRGLADQGAMRLYEYAGMLETGEVDGGASPRVTRLEDGAFRVSGGGGFGICAMEQAVEALSGALERVPAAVAGVTEVGHTGRIGAYAEALAHRGSFGLVFGGGGHKAYRTVAPFGGRKGVLSTNPLAMAMPGLPGVPLSADFATSASGGGKLRLARKLGQELPPGQILDREGRPSVNPDDFFGGGVMLPAAGPKGSGMGMIAELLCYGMLGDPLQFNWVFLAFRLDLFSGTKEYRARAEEFLGTVNTCPPMEGLDQVYYPGQIEAARASKAEKEGVTLSDQVAGTLAEMADAKGLAVPEALR